MIMDPKLRRSTGPKLDRRNAVKNVKYDASSSSASSFDDLRTRSLDLSPLTSFRVKGDGELDHIYRSLGLSGPEDFAIPAAAWEATKRRSSSDVTTRLSSAEFEAKIGFEAEDEDELISVGPSGRINGDRAPVMPSGRINGDRPPVMPRGRINGDRPPVMPRGRISGVRMLRPVVDELIGVGPSGRINGDDFRSTRDGVGEKSLSNDDDDDGNGFIYKGRFRRRIKSWQKGELLGSGSYGTVYEGFTDDGFFFAVKEVSLLDQGIQGKQSILQLEQEISLLSRFEHENIVRYFGTDKDKNRLYIFLELVTKGSLANLYQKYNLRDSQVSAYTRQILNGLKYLHDQNVVHRDIKCSNILVDASGSVKLADFGLAKATKTNDVKSCKGTAFWMAPEVVNLKNHGYGLAADIWSLGCTVLEMSTGQLPYSDLEGMQALYMIGEGKPPQIPTMLSRDAQDFILKCIQVNPNDRPTAAELLDHPFVKRPLQIFRGSPSPHYSSRQA